MPYITPITDRTQADIDARTSKAFFNVADWVRIYGNAKQVHDLFVVLGFSVPFNTLSTPTQVTIPSVHTFNSFLENIETLRVAAGLPVIPGLTEIKVDWLEGSSAESPDYLDANDWERVLDILYNNIGFTLDYVIYCGVANAGQPRFYQHRWRQFGGWVLPSLSPVRRPRTGIAIMGTRLMRQNKWRQYG